MTYDTAMARDQEQRLCREEKARMQADFEEAAEALQGEVDELQKELDLAELRIAELESELATAYRQRVH